MNAVRTMLERLAKAGRVQRPGRGLYAKLNG
ncbi:type IV toxin-antitoxin system AbiEi family antitoxin domain-containing protein [Streptomyces sp. NRRL S-350]